MKKIKRFTALLLALILFCMSFPVSALASTKYIVNGWNSFNFLYNNSGVCWGDDNFNENCTFPRTYTSSSFYPASIKYARNTAEFHFDFTIPKGTEISYHLKFKNLGVKFNTVVENVRAQGFFDDDINNKTNFECYNYSYSFTELTYTFKTTVACNSLFFTSAFGNPVFDSSVNMSEKIQGTIQDCYVEIDDISDTQHKNTLSKLKDWFDSIFGWLKDIRDKISNGLSSVTSGISNLGDNVKGFFSDLKNNLKTRFENLTSSISTNFTNISNSLKTWFESVGEWFTNLSSSIGNFFSDLSIKLKEWFKNVGDWFSDLGSKIGGFFTNLWNNITGAITERVNAFHEWWDSLWTIPDGWHEEYQRRWTTWLNEHFGILVNTVSFVEHTFTLFTDFSQTEGLNIIIPKITIPVVNKVLLKRTAFNFDTLFENDKFVDMFIFYDTLVSCISSYFVFLYAKKTFFNIIDKHKRLED